MEKCESCGMPLLKADDYGGRKVGNKCCRYCCDERGKLKSKEEVRAGMIRFRIRTMNETPEQAAKKVDEYMSQMPAWKE